MRYSFNLSPLPRNACSETNSRNRLFFGEAAKCLLLRTRCSSSRFSKREIGRVAELCKDDVILAPIQVNVLGNLAQEPANCFYLNTIAPVAADSQCELSDASWDSINGYSS